MDYEHTQRGLWHLLLFAVAAVCLVVGWMLGGERAAHYVCLGVALVLVFIGLIVMINFAASILMVPIVTVGNVMLGLFSIFV